MAPIRKTLSALLAAAAAAAVFAAPEVTVDNMTYKGGEAAEGSILKAQFKLTNTGNETLKITSVRPGCGCTVVSYDSVIAPGKSGFIKPEVNLKGFRAGQMSRGVTVTSNAANNPTLHLMIEATVTTPPEPVAVSENYLDFENAPKLTVILTSPKKDLKVSNVVFKPQGGQNIPGWAANTPMKVKFTLSPSKTAREDGLYSYNLDLSTPGDGKESVFGNFEITTNHPDRKDVTIGGRVK